MKALFLTAGLATRFRPHTNKTPKALLPFLGIPLYLYGYELLKSMGVKNYIFNLHHLPAELKSGIIKHAEPEFPIHFSDETTTILGSAGAIKAASQFLDTNENFILHNGDEVYFPFDNTLEEAIKKHNEEERLATLIVMNHKEAGNKFGAVWVDKEDRVVGFGKQPFANASPKHYVGTMILNSRVMQQVPLKETNILYDTLTPLLKQEHVAVQTINCEWYETGNEADYILAHQEVFNKVDALSESAHFKSILKKYLQITPEILKQSPLLFKQGSVDVDESAEFDGFVWLQQGAKVGAGCSITNSVVSENVVIEPGTTIRDKLIL